VSLYSFTIVRSGQSLCMEKAVTCESLCQQTAAKGSRLTGAAEETDGEVEQ